MARSDEFATPPAGFVMSDRYLNFTNTKFGLKLTSMLGLPQPYQLRRRDSDIPLNEQNVAIGSVDYRNNAFKELEAALNTLGLSSLEYPSINKGVENTGDKAVYHALVFDARALQRPIDSIQLYDYFNKNIRLLQNCGRIILLGRTPEHCESRDQRVAQTGLQGFIRSLAKECRKGTTAQLIYDNNGKAARLQSTLRFLLSGDSAYVSGQMIWLQSKDSTIGSINWELPLRDQKVLVTGASQGIGLAIAELITKLGGDLYCLDIPQNQKALESTAMRLGGEAIALDVSSDHAPETLLEIGGKIDGWDVLIHNAGITRDKTIAKMSEKDWIQVVDVNLAAQQRINDCLLEQNGFSKGARIVCVSSISGIAGNRGQTNYAYSKAAVIGMVEAYSQTLDKKGMTINAVAPGFIETAMTGAIPLTVREAGRRLNSLSQGGQPRDVAEVIAWLAHPASFAVNGNIIRVCGQSLLGA